MHEAHSDYKIQTWYVGVQVYGGKGGNPVTDPAGPIGWVEV
jgi:hypothetical protein